ncbi:MAG: hypothetical protein ACJ77Z_09195 [Thermoleophilaceae bacterium]|jgi:hypothetical protein
MPIRQTVAPGAVLCMASTTSDQQFIATALGLVELLQLRAAR